MDQDLVEHIEEKLKSHSNCTDMQDLRLSFFLFECGLLNKTTKEEFIFFLNEFFSKYIYNDQLWYAGVKSPNLVFVTTQELQKVN